MRSTSRKWTYRRIAVLGLLTSVSCVARSEAQQPRDFGKPVRTTVLPSEIAAIDRRDAEFAQIAEDVERLQLQQSLLRRVVKVVSPSIVHIEAIKETKGETSLTSGRAESKRVEEAGAGVLMSILGDIYVVTNRHVIHSAAMNAIKVETNDKVRLPVKRVLSDASTDTALLQVTGRGLLPARLGDSSAIEIGDSVFAIGSPFGLSHSVTSGIISAKGRRNLELGTRAIDIQDFFQTDTAINPGNSGGPLLNMRGEVIGINTAIASNSGGNEGIGFSIPINLVSQVAKQLVSNGQLQRGYLGVVMDNQFDSNKAKQIGLNQTMGALVKAVKPGSPAEQAGIRPGDLILEFNGSSIDNDGHLVQTVGLTPTGRSVPAIILRDGQRYEVSISLTEMPAVY